MQGLLNLPRALGPAGRSSGRTHRLLGSRGLQGIAAWVVLKDVRRALGKLKVLPAVDITPTMTCQVRMIQISAILRVSLAPVLPDLPFVGAVSLSLMTPPYLDFDLRRGTPGPGVQCISGASRKAFDGLHLQQGSQSLGSAGLQQGLDSATLHSRLSGWIGPREWLYHPDESALATGCRRGRTSCPCRRCRPTCRPRCRRSSSAP